MANAGQRGAIIPTFQCSSSMKEASWVIKISPTITTVATNVCFSTRNGAECFTTIISQKLMKLALPCPLFADQKLGFGEVKYCT